MSGHTAAFKQSDVTRAIRGVQAGGCEISEVEVTPEGKIRIVTSADAAEPTNEWDDVLS